MSVTDVPAQILQFILFLAVMEWSCGPPVTVSCSPL